jgi:coenzyme F420-reducing hydrogenase alpha subunit
MADQVDTQTRSRRIRTAALARVEGEGAMSVRIRGREVLDVQLRIYEPPRFFEALLKGRSYTEVPDITARICGICPVAYQTSGSLAIEQACGVVVDGPIRDLRRLMYCGEWIESHALHLYLLHAPDFLGYESAIHMAADHQGLVERGLATRKIGNRLLVTVGGRAEHPINPRTGGFYRAPSRAELEPLIEPLQRALQDTLQTIALTATLTMPEFERDYEFVALRDDDGRYPIDCGRIVSSSGLDIPADDFDEHFVEEHVSHSNALHSRLRDGGSYMVGPLARYSLAFDSLSPLAREAARDAGLGTTCRNPFQSIIVRGVELLYAIEEALRLIESYEQPGPPAVALEPRDGVGCGVSEAPRGVLWHRYEIDASGAIRDARIVPPTSQNQRAIEEDLRGFVAGHLDLPDDELQWQCEQAIRNYDPCISCATHFLKLDVERT